MPRVPHFALPMRLLPSGDFATVELNSPEEVAQHAAVVLRTPLGSRLLRPTMGLADPTFTLTQADGGSPTLRLVEEQLAEFEPRAEYHASAEGASTPEWVDRVSVDITGVTADG